MKITTILGSPKKKGKTGEALGYLEKELIAAGHTIDHIHVTDYRINGCLGCFACMQNPNEPGCVQKDDAAKVLERITTADAVIYASPIYSFDVAAQLKPLIDRHLCLSNTKLLDGKRMSLLITCGGQEAGNADLALEFFRRAFDGANGGYMHTQIVFNKAIPNSFAPDFSERAKEAVREMAAALSVCL